MGPVWFAVRSSTARFLAPAGLLVAVLVSFQGGWTRTGWDAALQTAVNHSLVLGVIVTAASALDARRRRFTEPPLASTARGLAPSLVALIGVVGWGAVAMSVLFLGGLAATSAVAAWRTPNLLLVLVGWAWLFAIAGIGWTVGLALPYFLSVPLALLIGWLASAVLAVDTDGWPAIFTAIDDGGFTSNYVPNTPVLIAQVLFLISIGLIGPLASSARRLRRGTLVCISAAVVCGLTVATVLVTRSGPARRIEVVGAAGPKICAGGGVAMAPTCAWPDNIRAQRIVSSQAAAMWRPFAEAGTPTPAGVVDEGLAAPGTWVAVPLWTPEPANLADSLSRATLAWWWCGRSDARLQGADIEVFRRQTWLVRQVESNDPGLVDDELGRILATSMKAQAAWVHKRPTGLQCR